MPVKIEPRQLGEILTAIGLEVESLEKSEEVKGSLEGLVIGEVLDVAPHPNADKLKLTFVNTGGNEPLKIVCGAHNVAPGQKVVVAGIGVTIYPVNREPVTMKLAKIRGEESFGMICAEDEIGLGSSHNGILVLPENAGVGLPAKEYFQPAEDWVFEIGLTPNRMDAMSHIGVAKDVCAYLSNLENKNYQACIPSVDNFRTDNHDLPIAVVVENLKACPRYSGVSISGIRIGESPAWLQQKLKAIGSRPVNNIVDITNFVLHECGQPLHAFDAAKIKGREVIVKNLPAGTPFITLDEKERKLDKEDLMICDAEKGMCIAGVFGGLDSGIKDTTTEIFLESACFSPASIRPTSFRHGLRTDAATRFEKGVDISNTLFALKRAALLILELGGGKISSDIVDIYPLPKEKAVVELSYGYLYKLSGKKYSPEKVKNILPRLGFDILRENAEGLTVAAPFNKPDITLPADVVEEVMRIDGYDNVDIPSTITISPSIAAQPDKEAIKEKISGYLSANGFYEIFTNSITNSRYFPDSEQEKLVKMINSLSAGLDTLRPSMLETGLESIAYNLNRQQDNLLLFEFGKTYSRENGQYIEKEHLCLYFTGNKQEESWTTHPAKVDSYFEKGFLINIFAQLGISAPVFEATGNTGMQQEQTAMVRNRPVAVLGEVTASRLKQFNIRQPVWQADIDWDEILLLTKKTVTQFRKIPKFPAVRRDLALILDKQTTFAAVEKTARSVKSTLLQHINLFDVFESEKLGKDKKSYAVSFTFQDAEKTLTDNEIDQSMNQLINAFETRLHATIRK